MRLNRLEKHIASAAVAAGFASAASAAIVTWNINLAVPATLDGLYIKIDTQQATTAAGGTLAGWDINPYGSTSLSFFASATSPAPATTYVRTQASGGPSSLALGTVIGGSSPFANSTTAVVSSTGVGANGWSLNSVNYFGFRFHNNTTNAINYGYGIMQVGASATSRTLLAIVYGDAGESVTVSAIPAPGAIALLGVAGLAAGRRRRA
jgi:MYXO-CTERM domain-containing protein